MGHTKRIPQLKHGVLLHLKMQNLEILFKGNAQFVQNTALEKKMITQLPKMFWKIPLNVSAAISVMLIL